MNPQDNRFQPRPPKPTLRPRKVYNGIKVRAKAGPDLSSWASQRWLRLAEASAPAEQFAEGIKYAVSGQARTLDVAAGAITARVQGRLPDAYTASLRLPVFSTDQWEQVLAAMTTQARYAATLLAGAMPANIEDIFSPLGLRLFPTEPSEVALSCTCDTARGTIPPGAPPPPPPPAPQPPPPTPTPWCKHICCIMALVADRLAVDPFLIFTLRGMAGPDLLERLSQRRSAANPGTRSAAGPTPIYLPHLPRLTAIQLPTLDNAVASFWTVGPTLDELELPLEPPEVSHPMLRRLGPSPFDPPGAKFPLVGLLATCYDMIGQASLSRALRPDPPSAAHPLPDAETLADRSI